MACVTDEQMLTIYRYCGFYNVKRNCFYDTIVQGFTEGLIFKRSDRHYKIQEPNNQLSPSTK